MQPVREGAILWCGMPARKLAHAQAPEHKKPAPKALAAKAMAKKERKPKWWRAVTHAALIDVRLQLSVSNSVNLMCTPLIHPLSHWHDVKLL